MGKPERKKTKEKSMLQVEHTYVTISNESYKDQLLVTGRDNILLNGRILVQRLTTLDS